MPNIVAGHPFEILGYRVFALFKHIKVILNFCLELYSKLYMFSSLYEQLKLVLLKIKAILLPVFHQKRKILQ